MQFINAGRRLLISAILLSLAACATQTKIGDTTQPLMPEGSGLVAATVYFATPHPAPTTLHFNFHLRYGPTDGQGEEWLLNRSDNRYFWSKDPRALPDEDYAKLLLAVVKPGKYRLTQGDVTPMASNRSFLLKEKNITNPREFEVVAGQVTYIGSIQMSYGVMFDARANKYGGEFVPSYINMSVKNDFDRDVRELKSLDPRLGSVVIKNALAK
ncbi:hypothetical protein [Noviherbaspirillum massiliense]|uniref:hypothetical protein n=1 Tax=Noviherbaspirillum massiliense TaxID=1465823 RepID=UPI0003825B84|nr:hypothetical protein [Noviherbaspirillum massiliense]